MNRATSNPLSSSAKDVVLWALEFVTAAALLLDGIGSLSGYPMLAETFDKIGVGHWFHYVTGGIEVISAILLLIPRLSPLGAALLACTTVGAVLSHLVLIGNSPPVPAIVMLSFATIILWGRFGTFKWRLLKLFALARAKCRETAISPERRSVLSSRG